MAEAFLRKHAGNRFEIHSAGLNPREIHPLTVRVMNEIGISLDGYRSKSLKEYLGKLSVRHVIFVCGLDEDSCPRVWPFTLKAIRWPFDDPAAEEGTEQQKLDKFRVIRDSIEEQVIQWVTSEDLDSDEAALP
jgi:arsenate reductase